MRKLLIFAILAILIGVGAFFGTRTEWYKQQLAEQSGGQNQQAFNKQRFSLTDPNSLWVIVNKNHPLPESFVPADLIDVNVAKRPDKAADELQLRRETALQTELMLNDAHIDGVNLVLGSGYRSYQLQNLYYSNYVANSGQATAEQFSAQPGKSEHQTGLAADFGAAGGKCYLEACFANEPEGQWLAANAHEFGFIMRYPEGKESITGYNFEPWHWRYVGVELAAEIHKGGQTLEEFFGVN